MAIVKINREGLNTGIDDNSDATAITIDSSERVGVGTASPAEKLDVTGNVNILGSGANKALTLNVSASGGTVLKLNTYQDNTDNRNWSFRNRYDAYGLLQLNRSTDQTGDSTTYVMGWDKDGGVRIGYAGTPSGASSSTQIVVYSDRGTDVAVFDRADSIDSALRDMIRFNRAGTTVGQIRCSNSATSYVTSSDYRLKENVNYDFDATTRLKQLKPARFNFIVNPDTTVDGFLAHEVSDIVPEAISGEKDAMKTEEYEITPAVLDEDGNLVTEAVMGTREVPDYQGIDQSKLVPILTKALQEAVTKIETLEARLTALENK